MMRRFLLLSLVATSTLIAQAPKGLPAKATPDETAAQSALAGKVSGFVVWSSSREGNHKIYSMSPDGSNLRKLTQGNKTDWYPRISPDGKRVLFTRSKLDWTAEPDATTPSAGTLGSWASKAAPRRS